MMGTPVRLATFICLTVGTISAIAQDATVDPPTNRLTAALRGDVEYLASDDLRGRGVTDESIHVAARFIADRMNGIGLKTDAVDGTPYQRVDSPGGQ